MSTGFITLQISNIPEFLKCSDFYEALSKDDDEITLPEHCFIGEQKIKNVSDMFRFVHTIHYWGIHTEEFKFRPT